MDADSESRADGELDHPSTVRDGIEVDPSYNLRLIIRSELEALGLPTKHRRYWTPEELADYLAVDVKWVYERTRRKASSVLQPILTLLSFLMVTDLMKARLPNIDVGCSTSVIGLNLVAHARSFPLPRDLPRFAGAAPEALGSEAVLIREASPTYSRFGIEIVVDWSEQGCGCASFPPKT
jgi:hypothetical protein